MAIKKPAELDFSNKKFMCIISGQPGLGKTTLALSAPKPFLFDTDNGIARVRPEQRSVTSVVESYEEMLGDMDSDEYKAAESVVIDTGGMLVQLMKDWAKKQDSKAYYCGVTETGEASAEYFPDLYEVQIGTANTPITAMSRHYSKLLVFKPEAVYATSYSAITLEDGSTTAGFYTVPIHREIGNEAPGQVQLVNNYPRSICAGNVFEWRLATTLYADERNAKNISARVQQTMNSADVSKIFAFDNNMTHEYFLFLNDAEGTVLVNNYETNVWYMFTGLPATCACADGMAMYLGFSDGRLVDFDHMHTSDDGVAIESRYESGNMSFNADYKRKTSSIIWVSMKPATNARILISARSDKKSDYAEKEVASSLSGFDHVNFIHWSFLTNRAPQIERIKLKVKKFVYYKIIITSGSTFGDVTVLGIDQKVRYTGNVK